MLMITYIENINRHIHCYIFKFQTRSFYEKNNRISIVDCLSPINCSASDDDHLEIFLDELHGKDFAVEHKSLFQGKHDKIKQDAVRAGKNSFLLSPGL